MKKVLNVKHWTRKLWLQFFYLDRNISCPHKTSTPATLYINFLLVVTDWLNCTYLTNVQTVNSQMVNGQWLKTFWVYTIHTLLSCMYINTLLIDLNWYKCLCRNCIDYAFYSLGSKLRKEDLISEDDQIGLGDHF